MSAYFMNIVPEHRQIMGLGEHARFMAFGYLTMPEQYLELKFIPFPEKTKAGLMYELQVEQRHTLYFRQQVNRESFMDSVLDELLAEVYRAGVVTVIVDVDDGNVHLGRFTHSIPPDVPVPTDEPLVDEPQFLQFLEKLIPDTGRPTDDVEPSLRLT